MARRKVAPGLLILISIVLVSSFLVPPYSSPQVRITPLVVKPQADFSAPSSQTGSGSNMNLFEFVYGWQAYKTKANNTLTSYQQRNAPPFSEPVPSPYTEQFQNLTVSNLTATYDVREVQYATGSTSQITANDTGSNTFAQVAMRFRSVEKANLTGIWMYYTSAGVANLDIVNSSMNSGDLTPGGRPTIATYSLPTALQGWHFVPFNSPVTMQAGFYYWVVVNATGMGITLVQWFYISEGGTQDSKYAAVYSGGWLNEANIHAFYPYLNLMLMLDVLPVNPTNTNKARSYNSPALVAMNETDSNTRLLDNRTSIPVGTTTFALVANTSVTFAVNWTASFEFQQMGVAPTHFVAQNGFTKWTVNFTSGAKPNPTTYPYRWVQRFFTVMFIPQFWNGSAPPPTIWNNQSYTPGPTFLFASGSYSILQMNNLTTDPWNAKWGISAKSTYAVTATMPSQVVVGLPITLNVSTAPYSPSSVNVSFYAGGSHVFSRNYSISYPSTSILLPFKFNETGPHNLYLFDQSSNFVLWSGNEVSLSNSTTISVLPADCNVTVTGRTSPVVGNIGALKFKFFNTTLGVNAVVPPQQVSVNGTLTANFVNDPTNHNTTVYVNTAGWRTGNNTVKISAKSGVYNASSWTWIVVQRPLSNVTFGSVNQPFLGGTASLSFKFFNKTLGASPLLINPASVKINGTIASFNMNSSRIVTVTWNTATGGWRVGLNHVNVSATSGIFSNYTIAVLTIIKPLSNVTVTSVNSPILGNPVVAQFKFRNGTNGWLPMSPITVEVNGTVVSFAYNSGSGITTVSWGTISGGWRSGLNHVNITAVSGVFFNSTVPVYQFTIIAPIAKLALNATSYAATYGGNVSVGFSFLNMTGGGVPFPSLPTLYMNGTAVNFNDLGGGSYAYSLNTRYFSQSGVYSLNFTAVYGTFVDRNITSVTVNKIIMVITLHLDETAVTSGSSLSAHATLKYPDSRNVEDHTQVVFKFTVTFANGTVRAFNVTAQTVGGSCSASFPATDQMKEIAVQASYAGDGTRTSASQASPQVPVTPPTSGFSVVMLAVTGLGGALVVVAVLAVRIRRRHGKETEFRKTAELRQTASLAQLLVVHLASGRCLFSRTIGSEEGADPNLVSGFLSANQTLISEVFKRQSGAGLKFADYGEYKVISDLGKHVMVTLFATETAGKELKNVLERFTEKFEEKYGKALDAWDGDMNVFSDADALADDVFAMPLTAPYMLVENSSAKLNKVERAAVHCAKIVSAERGGVFFMPRVIDYLLTKQGVKRGKAMDAISSLTGKQIFRQLTVEQAAQVIKSCMEQADTQS